MKKLLILSLIISLMSIMSVSAFEVDCNDLEVVTVCECNSDLTNWEFDVCHVSSDLNLSGGQLIVNGTINLDGAYTIDGKGSNLTQGFPFKDFLETTGSNNDGMRITNLSFYGSTNRYGVKHRASGTDLFIDNVLLSSVHNTIGTGGSMTFADSSVYVSNSTIKNTFGNYASYVPTLNFKATNVDFIGNQRGVDCGYTYFCEIIDSSFLATAGVFDVLRVSSKFVNISNVNFNNDNIDATNLRGNASFNNLLGVREFDIGFWTGSVDGRTGIIENSAITFLFFRTGADLVNVKNNTVPQIKIGLSYASDYYVDYYYARGETTDFQDYNTGVYNTYFNFISELSDIEVLYSLNNTVTITSLSDDFYIGDDYVWSRSGGMFDVPSTITFKNVNDVEKVPFKDGVECDVECTNIVNDGTDLTFDTSGEGNYTYDFIPNNPPVIDSTSPQQNIRITFGSSQYFTVTVEDLDNDTITYVWFLDGNLTVETTNSYFYLSQSVNDGFHTLEVVVTDGEDQDSYLWDVEDYPTYRNLYESEDAGKVGIDLVTGLLIFALSFTAIGGLYFLYLYLVGKPPFTKGVLK